MKAAFKVAGLLAVAALACPQSVLAWGAAGHSVVAEIAQQRLPPMAQRRLAAMLGSGRSLASVANWADTQAMLKPATRRWHYVNIPVSSDGYDAGRDCQQQADGDCLVAAIDRWQRALADWRTPEGERLEALRYLVHLIADAHQPLHCAERDGDAGGNKLKVQYFGVPLSLHNVWDFGILDRAGFDWGEHVRYASDWLKDHDPSKLAAGQPLDWIMESHRLAVSVAYDLPADLALGADYHERTLPVVHQQLAKAGVRLAALLKRALVPMRRPTVSSQPRPWQ